jgi:lipopolysaccharide/colanic/teichoic acid biosynthesis glycosyltransferase
MRLNYKFTKRLIDILGATFGLVILSPLLLLAAILIRLTMGKPVFFKQVRPGLNEKPFTIYKFRTMIDKRAPDGSALLDGELLTPLGRFLRKTSIDELPELWNVLKCDMSLVGPRPLLMQYLPLYDSFQKRRHEVKPGITGWAQVNGRNAITWEQKFEFDIYYIDHHGIGLDFRILLTTLVRVFTRAGIIVPGEATNSLFIGAMDKNSDFSLKSKDSNE